MSKKLPISGFKWIEPLTEEFIMNYDEENDKGYTLVVDLHYPEHSHDSHNDYSLCPEKLKPKGFSVEKLCRTF